jgi:hypothetical protein
MSRPANSSPLKRKLLVAGIVIGGLLTMGPVVGMLVTVFGMQRAFDELGQKGVKDPGQLSAEIGSVLSATFAGLVALPIGMLLTGFCIFFLIRQRRLPPPLPPASGNVEAAHAHENPLP